MSLSLKNCTQATTVYSLIGENYMTTATINLLNSLKVNEVTRNFLSSWSIDQLRLLSTQQIIELNKFDLEFLEGRDFKVVIKLITTDSKTFRKLIYIWEEIKELDQTKLNKIRVRDAQSYLRKLKSILHSLDDNYFVEDKELKAHLSLLKGVKVTFPSHSSDLRRWGSQLQNCLSWETGYVESIKRGSSVVLLEVANTTYSCHIGKRAKGWNEGEYVIKEAAGCNNSCFPTELQKAVEECFPKVVSGYLENQREYFNVHADLKDEVLKGGLKLYQSKKKWIVGKKKDTVYLWDTNHNLKLERCLRYPEEFKEILSRL